MLNLRIALYSHDTMGLGHIRRNQLISHALSSSDLAPEFLLISGTSQAAEFVLPAGVEMLILPSFIKNNNGVYGSGSHYFSIDELVHFRSETILAAVLDYAPDVFIVDKVPRGTLRELDPVLYELRKRGRTFCILGLRDVLDDPAVVESEWIEEENDEAIHDLYDAVWIYGDPSIYDAVQEYGFCTELRNKSTFTGYHDQRLRLNIFEKIDANVKKFIAGDPYVLCVVGGGQDGALLAKTFVQTELPKGLKGLLVTGPFMPQSSLGMIRACAAENPRMSVFTFVSEPAPLLKNAYKVIGMGGYNTVCEVLSFEKRSLIVPRVVPRREQFIRAQRFADHGLLDVLHWEDVSSDALSNWIKKDQPAPRVHGHIDFGGLKRIQECLSDLMVTTAVRSA